LILCVFNGRGPVGLQLDQRHRHFVLAGVVGLAITWLSSNPTVLIIAGAAGYAASYMARGFE